MPSFSATWKGYTNLWNKAKIHPHRRKAAEAEARRALANKARYQVLERELGIPWWWIAFTHNLEGGGSFKTYLGNGQPLNQVTTMVPPGRGPWKSWEAGAKDALKLHGLEKLKPGEWTIARALYEAERWNGFGYYGKGNSPYLWSFTDEYTKGKWRESPGKKSWYDPNMVSQQVGFATALKALIDIGGNEVAELKLQQTVTEQAFLAPTLVRLLAGAGVKLATRAILEGIQERAADKAPEAATVDPRNPDPSQVNDLLESLPVGIFKEVLRSAEDLVSDLVGREEDKPAPQELPGKAPEPTEVTAEPGATVVVSPPAPVQVPVPVTAPPEGWLDRILPPGTKTLIGLAAYLAVSTLASLGYLTPELATVGHNIALFIGGAGILAKVERILPVIEFFVKARGFLRSSAAGPAAHAGLLSPQHAQAQAAGFGQPLNFK